ncbi:HAD-IA family hydrolase [Celerinatantimonas yamalensis]|uniref:HAD-IA family hydrolase n=1 Tax=Celerinatantimonas yamalensis TaxID=559956 RepID=A0ABW9GAJ3_9GAMM
MRFYRSWQRPRALSFDLDDTLYDNRPHIRAANQWMVDTLADELGRRINWQTYKERVLAVKPALIHDVTECRRAWLYLGLKEQGIAQAKQRADELMDEFVAVRSNFTVPESSHQLLAELAERMPLVAMTNGNVDIQAIGLSDYFSYVYCAGGGYRQKPYADLFTAAATSLKLMPKQIAHVGDDPITDVYGALSNGYQAIWVNDRVSVVPTLLPHLEVGQVTDIEALWS